MKQEFKVGDKVICIDDELSENCLEYGKEYTVEDVEEGEIQQTNTIILKNVSLSWHKFRFKFAHKPIIEHL